jgi:HAD superfamily hydrolase (TIGR01509 family)
MIKVILFDLDGVLVNSRDLHYQTFKEAFEEITQNQTLSWKEHHEEYDGLSTKQKLNKMVSLGKITSEQVDPIFNLKQEKTFQIIPKLIFPRQTLIQLLETLSKTYRLAVVSNSIRKSLDLFLETLQISKFFEFTLSNEDALNPKPSPDLYNLAIQKLNVSPSECLICEDSERGRTAAYASGCHVLEVEDTEDLTEKLFEKTLKDILTSGKIQPRQPNQRINIVIPMAGEGSRFVKKGYTVPKPFIPVFGKPMIQWVIDNMRMTTVPFDLMFHFICRKSHLDVYDMSSFLDSIGIQYKIHTVEKLTEGAACTVLTVQDFINTDEPLVIVNSDQYLEWDPTHFYNCLLNPSYSGVISTFYSPDPSDTKWSFAKLSNENIVEEVAEKKWIGPFATTGIYGWKKGSDFVHYANQMISKNIRVNGEFYVCPVYNEAIQENGIFRVVECKKMWGLGVPEDLDYFLANHSD